MALVLAALAVSCGDTDSKSSKTGEVFVFQARARLNLVAQVDPDDPKRLHLTATLLDPQGLPLSDQRVTFEAEFPEAIFVPDGTNRGVAITDDNGQAKVTLSTILGPTNAPSNPDRLMRVIAEAPPSLDVATAISVPFTTLGFIVGGALSVTPPAVTFVNPLVRPGTEGPKVTFTVQGGRPPYTVDNQNKALGQVSPTSLPIDSNQFVYTVIGALPTDTADVLTDTITVTDAARATVTATVTVIFADCDLRLSVSTITVDKARGGETFNIEIIDGVPPFTATQTFPNAGSLPNPITQVFTFTVATPPVAVDPNTITVRDSRGCVGSVDVTITPACGDGTVDPGEVCDGTDFQGVTCADILRNSTAVGTLLCTDNCSRIDSSFCRIPPPPPTTEEES